MNRSRTACGFITTAAVSGLLVALPAVSASGASIDCPTALPTTEAVDGLTGTGYTVERGTTADEFSATVLGRVADGIAPGVDMIMADLSSPALERAGGVWAGMSGSPVYTADGRLIGSVSYGLAASSSIAGITPAEDLLALQPNTAAAESVPVSTRAAARIAATGEASKSLASQGFERLPLPISASGLAARNTKRYLKDITAASGMSVYSGGARIAPSAESSTDEIFAGSNYAAALSYGDISLSGLGTTTYVCGDTAVAFGHPLLSNGKVEYSVHPAEAVFIQPDPDWGPFKVGNPGGPVGTITRDGTIGLVSTLGQTPAHEFPVTSSLTNEDGKTVTGQTVGVYQPWAADIAALHVQSAVIKALGAQGAGSAAVKITVTGTRDKGKKFTVVHRDHYADSYDVSYNVADTVYYMLQPLADQEYEDVNITGITVTGTVSNDLKRYRVTKLETKRNGAWVPLKKQLTVKSAGKIPLRATLSPYRSTETIKVPITIGVPARSSDYTGSLTLSDDGGSDYWWWDESSSDSLDELLDEIRNFPSNDSLVREISLEGPGRNRSIRRETHLDSALVSFSRDVTLKVE